MYILTEIFLDCKVHTARTIYPTEVSQMLMTTSLSTTLQPRTLQNK